MNTQLLTRMFLFAIMFSILSPVAMAQKTTEEFYELKIYKLKTREQGDRVDAYLRNAYLPALHQSGIKNIGVFKPEETDTTSGKRIYVLVPYTSMEQFLNSPELLAADKQHATNGKDYIDAVYTLPPYERIESILLKAFTGMPKMEPSALTTPRSERLYELRSYESASEKIHKNKVQMFNKGDEVGLFKQLGFNAVFYAQVVVGGQMPNLMYMTTFANRPSREEHWKAFREAPQWKQLSAMEEYQHNVSKNTIYFLRPTEYSDY